jgi:hypothetical protein
VSYQDYYGESLTDTFPIGLVVVGRIELVVYDKIVNPQPATNGSKVEITMTLLNKGNVVAMYVNATIQPNEFFLLTSESTTYIGDVEENTQSPFTLAAYVKDEVENGTYPVRITVSYRDDQYVDHYFDITIFVTVKAQSENPPSSGETENIFGLLGESGLILLMVAAATIVILLLYRHSIAKQRAAAT